MPMYTVNYLHTCVDRFRVNAETPEEALKKVFHGLVATDDSEVVSGISYTVVESDNIVLRTDQCDRLIDKM